LEERLGPELRQKLDELLEVPPDARKAILFRLKEYPPEATPHAIASYLDRLRILRSHGVELINLDGIPSPLTQHLAMFVKRYDAAHLKRLS